MTDIMENPVPKDNLGNIHTRLTAFHFHENLVTKLQIFGINSEQDESKTGHNSG